MWNKEYTRRNQQQVRWNRASNQWFGRQVAENTQMEQQKEKKINENSLRDLWNIRHNNICIIGVPEREEVEKGIENQFEEIDSLMG